MTRDQRGNWMWTMLDTTVDFVQVEAMFSNLTPPESHSSKEDAIKGGYITPLSVMFDICHMYGL